LTFFGPVVAIGDPVGRNKLAVLGAARDYVTNGDWQHMAQELMQRAWIIVATVGRTEGLAWEIESIMRLGFRHKLVLLFPPVHIEELRSRWQFLVRSTSAVGFPEEIDLVHTRALLCRNGNVVLISADHRNDWTYETVLDEAVWVITAHLGSPK